MLPDALPTISYKQSLHVAFIRAIILGIQTTSSCLYIDLQTNQNQNNPESALTSPPPPPLTLFISPRLYFPLPPNELKHHHGPKCAILLMKHLAQFETAD